MSWISKMIDRVFAVAGAVLFAQFPQFYLQYFHEFKGHVAELKYQVSLIEHAALLSHKTLQEWVEKFTHSPDPDFSLQGQMLGGIINRLADFQHAETAMQTASIFAKPFLFLRYADKAILYDTAATFQFGISFTLETLVYSFLGLFSGYLIFYLSTLPFRKAKKPLQQSS